MPAFLELSKGDKLVDKAFSNLLTIDPESERVAFLGDSHGNLRSIFSHLETAAKHGVRQVFHAGDYQVFSNRPDLQTLVSNKLLDLDIQMWINLGNHDDYSLASSETVAIAPSLFVFSRPTMFQLGDKRVLALSGAGSVDREYLTEGVNWWPEEAVTDHDVSEVSKLVNEHGYPDWAITHDGPLTEVLRYLQRSQGLPVRQIFGSKVVDYCNGIQEKIQEAIDIASPESLFHGHHHIRYDAIYGRTRVHGLAMEEMAGAMLIVNCEDSAIEFESSKLFF